MDKDCKLCNKWKKHYYWSHLALKKMGFIRLMLADGSSHRMSMPKKFVNNFRGAISTSVDLKGPSGRSWAVGLTKAPDGVFLQSGWSDFVEAHSLKQSDILVFKYRGNSSFDVLVFDESNGCERESSYFVNEHDHVEIMRDILPHRPCSHDDDDDGGDDDAEAPPLSIPQPSIKRKAQNHGADQSNKTRSRKYPRTVKGANYPINEDSAKLHDRANIFISVRNLKTDAERRKAKELACAIQSRNPCFVKMMHLSSVIRHTFILPRGFVAAHLQSKPQYIILQTPQQEKKWFVTYLILKANSVLSRGWRAFVVENDLKKGDMCVFELIQGRKEIMTVHISRAMR